MAAMGERELQWETCREDGSNEIQDYIYTVYFLGNAPRVQAVALGWHLTANHTRDHCGP